MANRHASETYRRAREAEGFTQVQIWIEKNLRQDIDTFMKANGFRNRSELVNAALDRMMKEQPCN